MLLVKKQITLIVCSSFFLVSGYFKGGGSGDSGANGDHVPQTKVVTELEISEPVKPASSPAGSGSAPRTATTCKGITYYANSASGDDTNDGLSPKSAVKSIGHGVGLLNKSGGDTLVLTGNFPMQELKLIRINNPVNGTPDPSRITTIRCGRDTNGKRQPAVIDGGLNDITDFPFDLYKKARGKDYLDRGIVISESNWIVIDGVDVTGIAGLGILVWKSNHISLSNLKVEFTSQSAMMLGNGKASAPYWTDLTVDNCRVNQVNLGRWIYPDGTLASRRLSLKSEAVSIVHFDGFVVSNSHISNSFMEGLDFKVGSKNGKIRNNIIENCNSVGIYANEGADTDIYENIIRYIGYYDPEDGSGLQPSIPYVKNTPRYQGIGLNKYGGVGILISNGDLLGPASGLETGKVYGINVYSNIIYWTRLNGISLHNEWKKEGLPGWKFEDFKIYNNTLFNNCAASTVPYATGALSIGDSATRTTVANNIITKCGTTAITIWDPDNERNFFLGSSANAITNNLFHNNQSNGTTGSNAINSDPLFIAPPQNPGQPADFQLKQASPAIDAGITTGLPVYKNTKPDIGAYERGLAVWIAGFNGAR